MASDYDRAKAYLSAIPAPGEGGRNVGLNGAAYAVRERFPAIGESDFAGLLNLWARSMVPPLSPQEIETTIRSAWRGAEHRGAVGSKATASRGPLKQRDNRPLSRHMRDDPEPQAKAEAVPSANYTIPEMDCLPEAIENGAIELMSSAFRAGEGICVAQGRISDEDGREHPKDDGITLTAAQWTELFGKKGGVNGTFSSSKGAGVFVRINPMRPAGAKDSDVTAYRHALIEIDSGLSPVQQYALWVTSEIPCAAIISSGGKSVHAWVKIEAKDRREYDERVALLHQHFGAYGIDTANKNPSRFSRLPDAKRGKRRQELLALNMGCPSWSSWLQKLDCDALGKSTGIAELLSLDTGADPNCVIGFRDGRTLRYLCRGKSAWLLGPSGIGKSSLVTEFAVGWALGLDVWGISPGGKRLKSLVIQAENDQHDLAEMAQGIARAYNLDSGSDALAAVTENVRFRSETRSVGPEFVDRLHRMIDADRPDIVWIDPLLSFAGIDVNKQDQVSAFLRTQLNPVLESTGAVAIGVHHTGKPKGAKETKGWTAIDWAYSGLGSSELVNWARAVMLLRPLGDGLFNLMLAKRGKRAGARHPDGDPTTNLFLRHATVGIRWEQSPPPEEPTEDGDSGEGEKARKRGGKAQGTPGRPSVTDTILGLQWLEVTQALPAEGVSGRNLTKRAGAWLATMGHSISHNTLVQKIAPKLVETHRLQFDGERYFSPGISQK